MKRKTKMLIGTAVLVALLGAGTAEGLTIRAGDIIVIGDGGFRPTKLPKHHDAPITIYGGGRIDTVSGDLPPILETITFEFDRHGSVDTTGLPVCTAGPARGDDRRPGARQHLPGVDRRQGQGHGDRRVPRTGADPGLLADHDLQRAEEARQPDRPRPRLPTVPVVDHLHRPGRDRKNPQGRLRLPDQSADPEDRQRRRHPDLRQPHDRPTMDLQGRASTATSTPAAKPVTFRPAGSSPSRTALSLRGTFFRPCQVPDSASGRGGYEAPAWSSGVLVPPLCPSTRLTRSKK